MVKESLASLWRESIDFFAWENFRLFSLATLNTFKRTATLLVKYFWWLFVLVIVAEMFGFSCSSLLFLTNFFSILAVRPSIEPKGIRYFLKYLKKIPGYFLISCLFVLSFLLLGALFNAFLLSSNASFLLVHYCFLTLVPMCLSCLFFFDVKNNFSNTIKVCFKSIKFCFYFLPTILMFVFFERLFFYFFFSSTVLMIAAETLSGYLFCSFLWIAAYLLTLLPLTALSVYYTKIKHNHHLLFFGS